MASKNITTCDRCGKEIHYIGWTIRFLNIFKIGTRIKSRRIYNGNPDGYSYSEDTYELCADCTRKFKEFLGGKENE